MNKNHYTDLLFLTTIACQLAECLDDDELSLLSANLSTLSGLLNNVIIRRVICENDKI